MDRVKVHADFASIEGEWEELARETGSLPFLWPGWVQAWWDAFGSGTLEIIAVRRGGRLVAALPVQRRPGRMVGLANWHTPVYGPVALDPEAGEALAHAVMNHAPAMVDLPFLAAEDPVTKSCERAARRGGRRVLSREVSRSPYIALEGTFDEYEESLPARLRRETRRRWRKLEAEGEVALDVLDGQTGLDGLLEEVFDIEAAGWKGAQGSAIASSADTRAFYTAMARWAAERDLLRLHFLRLDGRSLAFRLCLEHAGTLCSLKTGYRPGHRALAPGTLILYAALRRAYGRGLRSFEMLGVEDPYKLRWTDRFRSHVRLQAFDGSLPGRAAWIAHARIIPRGRRAAEGLAQRRRRASTSS